VPNLIADLLERNLAQHPDKTFVVTTDGLTMSYGETHRRAHEWARHLHRWGVQEGDRVILAIDSRPEFSTLWFACHLVGAVPAPHNPGLPDHSTRRILQVISPTLCVRGTATDPARVGQLMAEEGIPVVDIPPTFDGEVIEDQLPDRTTTPWKIPDRTDSDPAHIIWSSGTTGSPKGAVMPMSWVAGGPNINAMLGLGEDDRWMTPLPLFHSFGVLHHLLALHAGGMVVLPPRFSASQYLHQAREFGATVMQHVGGIISFLLKQPPGEIDRQHSIRITFGGGAPPDLWLPFEERFGIEILEGWAATEFGIGTFNPPGGRKGSIGRVSPQVELRIVDGDDRDLPDGEIGEALVRPAGSIAFEPAYFGDAEATQRAIRNGWFATGDLLSRDKDGWYYFHGRTKDTLRRRGENIVPEDLESYLEQIEEIAEVAAVGVPCPDGDDDIKLSIVTRQTLDDDDVRRLWDRIVAVLPRSMRPRYLEFRTSLPYTPTHKLQRVKLRQAHECMWDGDSGTWTELDPSEQMPSPEDVTAK
jgi:carnitine-CoA ligase